MPTSSNLKVTWVNVVGFLGGVGPGVFLIYLGARSTVSGLAVTFGTILVLAGLVILTGNDLMAFINSLKTNGLLAGIQVGVGDKNFELVSNKKENTVEVKPLKVEMENPSLTIEAEKQQDVVNVVKAIDPGIEIIFTPEAEDLLPT